MRCAGAKALAHLGCNGALHGSIDDLRCLGSLRGEEALSQRLQRGAQTSLDSAPPGLGMYVVIRRAGSNCGAREVNRSVHRQARSTVACLRCTGAL